MDPRPTVPRPPLRALSLWAVAAGLLRLALHLGPLASVPAHDDAVYYLRQAARLAFEPASQGRFFWPAGTALLVSLCQRLVGEPGLLGGRVAMALCGAALALVCGLLGWELGGSPASRRRRALWAAGLAALYPPSWLLAGQPLSQHIAAVSLGLVGWFGLVALRRTGRARALALAGAGLALGYGVITRPSMLSLGAPLALVLACWLGGWPRSLRNRLELSRRGDATGPSPPLWLALIPIIATLLPIAPVLRHNQVHGAGLSLSTNNERNFFLGNNRYTPHYKTSHLAQRTLDQLPDEVADYLRSIEEEPDPRAAMTREALGYLRTRPLWSALRVSNRMRSFWGFDYLASRQLQGHFGLGNAGLLLLLALEGGGYLLVMGLALVGLFEWSSGRDSGPRDDGSTAPDETGPETDSDETAPDETAPLSRRGRTWLLLLVAGYALPYTLAFSGGAYHFPVMALLLPVAAEGLALLRNARRRATWLRGRWPRWAALAALAAIQLEYAWFLLRWQG